MLGMKQVLPPKRNRLRTTVLAVVGLIIVLMLGYKAIHHEPGITVAPPIDAPAGRWIILDGANNTRDLGGYITRDGRVRWRTVYRSGRLSGLTDAGSKTYCDLGIRRVIDFRYRMACSPLFNGDAFSVFRCSSVTLLPVHAVSSKSAHPYVENARQNSESYRHAFELIASSDNLPVLFHCLAGKDRTGIMAALLLTLLGVNRETVLEDFMLSNHVERPVNRAYMSELFDEVDRSGGIEVYLEAISVSRATQERIRTLLLE
jgi:protein-tyrosine phosphatase